MTTPQNQLSRYGIACNCGQTRHFAFQGRLEVSRSYLKFDSSLENSHFTGLARAWDDDVLFPYFEVLPSQRQA
jgi:hypothetical protein